MGQAWLPQAQREGRGDDVASLREESYETFPRFVEGKRYLGQTTPLRMASLDERELMLVQGSEVDARERGKARAY